MSASKNILLIISGSIAAYKSAEIARILKKHGHNVTCVLTEAGKKFITPMTLAALSGNIVYDDMFSLRNEVEMGHINLSRQADLILVAPASCDIIAKMAVGIADDLATTILLATNKPVIVAPAMNPYMWEHKATQRNIKQLTEDGIKIIGPEHGEAACQEIGQSRMAEPADILEFIQKFP